MATFTTYAEVLRPDHPLMKVHQAALTWRPSRARPASIDRDLRAAPGAVLGDLLERADGGYATTTRLTGKFRADLRETAVLTSDDQLRWVAEAGEAPVSLEHLRPVDRSTRLLIGYRLTVSLAESPRWCRRLAFPPDPAITLHLDEVPFPGAPGRFWSALRWDTAA